MNIATLYHEPHVYAYSIAAKPGWLKIGYTDRQTVQERIDQDLKTPNISYTIEMDEVSSVRGGMFFRDSDIHKILEAKNFLREYRTVKDKKTGLDKKVATEWFKCGVEDVLAVVRALQNREDPKTATKKNTFGMRDEQRQAVKQTKEYFNAHRRTPGGQPPSYLWNAKMRFGKTFATYKLMEAMKWKKVLVLTFKPAVEDSWQSDLEGHEDFKGWQFVSKSEGALSWEDADKSRPVVWFGSFQDFLQLDGRTGEYKARNQVAFDVEWDCVVVDEYHFGAWRSDNREFTGSIEDDETWAELGGADAEEFDIEKSPLKAKHYLMLSGTPFRAIKNGEFGEDQIFNWTYSDEQKAKSDWNAAHPGKENPYAMLPRMNMLVYRLPDKIARVAEREDVGFDLNEFFRAERKDGRSRFVHENEVSKWLDFMRGEFFFDGAKPVLPFYDVEMKRALRHTVWYLPGVASCEAMRDLLDDAAHRNYYGQYEVICCAGSHAGVGKEALESVRPYVIADPLGTATKGRSITLTCGKLTTGVTIPAWTAILMLRSMKSPESYFQAAFRVQSPWTMRNADGKSPNDVTILKENCYILDFALNRALAQIADYSANLSDKQSVPVDNVKAFINFMPVICYDGSKMAAIDAGEVLELAYTGISGSAMARRWNSNDLLNITPSVLDSMLNDKMALDAIGKIEGFANPRGEIKAFVNQTKKVNSLKGKAREGDKKAKTELTEEEKKLRKQRSAIEKKLKKFATRIPIFMYLSDYREEALVDVIRNLEPALFTQVTGLSIRDFELLIDKGVFNSATMNSCIWQFRAYEEESLDYLHLREERLKDDIQIGGFNSIVTRKEAYESLEGSTALSVERPEESQKKRNVAASSDTAKRPIPKTKAEIEVNAEDVTGTGDSQENVKREMMLELGRLKEMSEKSLPMRVREMTEDDYPCLVGKIREAFARRGLPTDTFWVELKSPKYWTVSLYLPCQGLKMRNVGAVVSKVLHDEVGVDRTCLDYLGKDSAKKAYEWYFLQPEIPSLIKTQVNFVYELEEQMESNSEDCLGVYVPNHRKDTGRIPLVVLDEESYRKIESGEKTMVYRNLVGYYCDLFFDTGKMEKAVKFQLGYYGKNGVQPERMAWEIKDIMLVSEHGKTAPAMTNGKMSRPRDLPRVFPPFAYGIKLGKRLELDRLPADKIGFGDV